MPKRATSIAMLVLTAAVMAGCVQEPAGTKGVVSTTGSSAAATVAAPPEAAGTATIGGHVTDTELLPVAGARVVLRLDRSDAVEPLAEAISDELGNYAFTSLSGGAYVLFAQREGHQDSRPRAIDIVDGQEFTAHIVLERLAAREAYHVSVGGKMRFTNVACYKMPPSPLPDRASPGWHCASGTGLDNVSKVYNINQNDTGELRNIIVDATWTLTLPGVCYGSFRVDLKAPGAKTIAYSGPVDTPSEYDAPRSWSTAPDQVDPPVRIFVSRDGEGPEAILSANRTEWNGGTPLRIDGNWSARPWYEPVDQFGTPVDFTCHLQQDIEYWMTLFFLGDAPRDWSFYDS